eukprot:COSAG04_NODE_169_length_21636_cov_32.919023_12_plen_108_part_00
MVGSAEGPTVQSEQGLEQESRTASPQWKVPPVAAPPSLFSTSQSFTATQRPVPASTIEVVPFMSTAQIWLLSPARQVSSDSGDHDRAVAHGTAAAAAAVAAHSPRIV